MKIPFIKSNWINNKKYWPYILWGSFLFVSVLSLWSLWGTTPRLNHDNLAEFWLAGFDRLIKAGQWHPTWVKEFYFGYGNPLFVFYPPLFFYLAEISRLLGATLVIAIKIAVGFSFMLAFWSMYILAKEMWGKWVGLVAGLIYMTMPYHFTLIFIRGSYAENLSYALFPLLLLFIYQVFSKSNGWAILKLAVTVAVLLLINIPSAVVAGILGLLIIVGLGLYYKRLPGWGLYAGLLGGFGLSAFFWLPVVINQHLIQSSIFFQGQNAYINHFMSLSKYLRTDLWDRDNYFQIGWLSVAIVLIAVVYVIVKIAKSKLVVNDRLLLIFLGTLSILIFLTLPVSMSLWQSGVGLMYIQFPFRLLGAIAIMITLLSGNLITKIASVNAKFIGIIVLIILIQTVWFSRPVMPLRPPIYKNDLVYTPIGDMVAQINYPDFFSLTSNEQQSIIRHTAEWGYAPKNVSAGKFVDEAWPIEQSFYKTSFSQALAYQIPIADLIKTNAKINNFVNRAMGVEFDATATQPEEVIYHQVGFPGWQIKIDDKNILLATDDNQRIKFTVPAGFHKVSIKYTNAPGTQLGSWISLIFLLAIILWGYFLKKISP